MSELQHQVDGHRVIYLDHPEPGVGITRAQVFDGWTISPDPSEEVAVAVNGRPVQSHQIPRPDVEAVHPGLNSKGFMFFFEPDASTPDYRVQLRVGDTEREVTFTLSADDLRGAAEGSAAREKHRAFLSTVLACPKCHLQIHGEKIEGRQWACERCGEQYDCRGGLDLIPESYANKAEIRFQGAICSHAYDGNVQALISRIEAAGGMVLDCGAGWRSQIRPAVITTEILRYPSTDVVAVGEHLPFGDGSFDAVISLHVLEHVKNPFVCAEELIRVLKPGGTLYAITPYIVAVHRYPFHFFNPTPSGLLSLFDGKILGSAISVPRAGHPLGALKDLLGAYAYFFDAEGRDQFRRTSIGELVDSNRDALLSSDLAKSFRDEGKRILAGNYCITGTKP